MIEDVLIFAQQLHEQTQASDYPRQYINDALLIAATNFGATRATYWRFGAFGLALNKPLKHFNLSHIMSYVSEHRHHPMYRDEAHVKKLFKFIELFVLTNLHEQTLIRDYNTDTADPTPDVVRYGQYPSDLADKRQQLKDALNGAFDYISNIRPVPPLPSLPANGSAGAGDESFDEDADGWDGPVGVGDWGAGAGDWGASAAGDWGDPPLIYDNIPQIPDVETICCVCSSIEQLLQLPCYHITCCTCTNDVRTCPICRTPIYRELIKKCTQARKNRGLFAVGRWCSRKLHHNRHRLYR